MKAATKRKVQVRILLVLGALIVVYVCSGLFNDKLNALETRLIDQLFVLRPKVKPADPLKKNTVAHVDANSYFSRPQHGQVIRNLAAMKVSAQLVDFIFEDMVSKAEDQPLIDATKAAGNVYFGLTFDSLSKPIGESNYPPETDDYINPSSEKWQVVLNGTTESFYFGGNPRLPYLSLAASAQGLGFMNLTPDPDGILRRLPLLVRHNGVLYPSLSFRTVCEYLGIGPENIIVNPGRSITLKGVRPVKGSEPHDILIPIDKNGRMILNVPGFGTDIPHFRYSEIFQASQNSAKWDQLTKELSGKIVVLSETLGKQYKTRLTGNEEPLSSGVIHALVIQNILSGTFLNKLSAPAGVFIEIGILADVCDKGVGAALFMALFRSFIRVLSGTAHSDGHLKISDLDTTPGRILQRTIRSINNYISITHEQASMFATIFMASSNRKPVSFPSSTAAMNHRSSSGPGELKPSSNRPARP